MNEVKNANTVNIKNIKIKKTKIKKKYIIIALIIITILTVINVIGLYVGNMYYEKVCRFNINPKAAGLEYYKPSFNYNRFLSLESYNVSIQSSFGYKLSGTYIFNSKPTNNTVIIVHGIGCDRWESMKYADMYIDMGFNVLVYDSRYHGKSGGNDITLGFFEKYDLNNIAKWVRWVNPKAVIGIHGESLGAVTSLLQSKLDEKNKNVNFYVVDCPYSDLSELVNIKLSKDLRPHFNPLGNFIIFYGNIVALIKSNFSLYNVSPINAVKDIKTPIMFIHGSNDTFIPASMSLELYLRKQGAKDIYISPGAEHAMSILVNKKEYQQKVKSFLIKNKMIKK